MTHADITLAAVVGIADERVGEEIKAFVITRPGTTLAESEVIAWCRDRLAVYKCPRTVQFCHRASAQRHRQGPQTTAQRRGSAAIA